MRSTLVVISVAATIACNDSVAPEPAYVFGRVTARIDQAAWESSYFPDSVVAFYEPSGGHLQVTGQQVGPGQWPTLHIIIASGATVGAFPLTSDLQLNNAQWFPGGPVSYVSSGAAMDSVWLEELDPTTEVVQGHFRFTGRNPNGAQTAKLEGRFLGHMILVAGPSTSRRCRLTSGCS